MGEPLERCNSAKTLSSFFFRIFIKQKKKEGFLFLRDQPDLIIIEDIVPGPVEEDDDAVAEADDAVDVQEDPDHPGDESAEGDAEDAGHGGIASDGGEQTGVFVVEGCGGLSLH